MVLCQPIQAVHHDCVAGDGPFIGKRSVRHVPRLSPLVAQLRSKSGLSDTVMLDGFIRGSGARLGALVVERGSR